ncbi:PREDICTED: tigger transposable element-derived protein 6-like [Amphimedon queenslandica]|uniref:HTH CENPB-type domain-containing protein n=1 Tax=Amphimedon queenslandica TaxID=400682 RepID=A0A1X7U6T3_AMPQE|nr:PREDICTED: tigger transposable element-derived protein 6-like [Amphimedon queenslandica]|eukprot:XP_011405985.1 PREDICTED: tigger transposable element-derived protein 6-like [Amphimedon queenslandica]
MADLEVSQPAIKKKYNFDASLKLKVVEVALKNSNRGAARKFDVDEQQVREWKEQRNSLTECSSKKKRLDGGGQKVAQLEMEELVSWIDCLREQNLRVTRSSIQAKALELSPQSEEEFRASRGWLEKFLSRHGFSSQQKTTVSQ